MNNNMQPILKMSSSDGVYHEYVIQYGINLIGRLPDDDTKNSANLIAIVAQDHKLSRNHFYIEWGQNPKGEHYLLLFDKNSTNGTFLQGYNEQPLDADDKIYLIHNDQIIAGDTHFYIHIPTSIQMIKALIIDRSEDHIKTVTWGSKN
jgi:pSer/pThr/pTyr-binding forkhead associated (FHA) protein